MAIDFTLERWRRTKDDYRRWWDGELGRPIMQCILDGYDPHREPAELPAVDLRTIYDLSIPAEKIVDRWDYDLCCRKFLGDAFPIVWPNFGPGVMATFLGARPEPRDDTVWFLPSDEQRDAKISDINFNYDPDNVYLNRIKDVCRAAVNRWGSLVQISMTDLGGSLDIVSTFRPGQKLLLDLCDNAGEVKRLLWQASELWKRYYREINEILEPTNPGYSAWAKVYSPKPSYMLQCDFCYMISPEMFEEFVKPELVSMCRWLEQSFYHLDGPGQLPHLDSILAIEELGGVQWIPGAGEPNDKLWFDVYEKILGAGKLAQIFKMDRGVKILDHFASTGQADGLLLSAGGSAADEEAVTAVINRYMRR
ncbi:MAG: hypothetical protein J7M14_07965 [Planctomycetes bacterium]|nr:hypothetical protein [Planctomycetota bacterium]